MSVSAYEFLQTILKDGMKKQVNENMEVLPSKNIGCSTNDLMVSLYFQDAIKI